MPKSFEKEFISFCDNQKLEVNINQIHVVKKLDQYYRINFKSFFSKLFSKKIFKKGFYLYGDVGVGKTMILNFFFDQINKRKLRKHFNEFMLSFHDFAHKRKEKWEGGEQRGRLPAYATPQRGAAIAEAVPKHNSQTRSGPGDLGGSLPDRRCTGLGTRR